MKIAEMNETERQRLVGVFQEAGLEMIEFPSKDKENWSKNPVFAQYAEDFIKEQEAKGHPAQKMVDLYLSLVRQ